jgi:hypothetical protein
MRVAILVLATALFVLSGSPSLAQRDFPATAVIRGENIWLRVDPAEDTEVLTYLQRGDPIRVTGDAVAADGDAFYPVEVIATGETGWVRDLAVDPRSLTEIAELPEVVVDEPPAVDVTPETERRNNRQQGGNREATTDLSFSGTGVDVTEEFTLEPGRYRVIGSVQPGETGNFAVYLIGPGDFEELLFNEIPESGIPWEGETSVRITESGEYAIQVDIAVPGPWTFQIEPM